MRAKICANQLTTTNKHEPGLLNLAAVLSVVYTVVDSRVYGKRLFFASDAIHFPLTMLPLPSYFSKRISNHA